MAYKQGLRLLLDCGRPSIGHLLFLTIYYYPLPLIVVDLQPIVALMASILGFLFHPPPLFTFITTAFGLLILGSFVIDHDIACTKYLLSTACNLFLKLKYKRTSMCYATQFPSSGLQFSVDCSVLFDYHLMVFSMIQLQPEYRYLLNEGVLSNIPLCYCQKHQLPMVTMRN